MVEVLALSVGVSLPVRDWDTLLQAEKVLLLQGKGDWLDTRLQLP